MSAIAPTTIMSGVHALHTLHIAVILVAAIVHVGLDVEFITVILLYFHRSRVDGVILWLRFDWLRLSLRGRDYWLVCFAVIAVFVSIG